MLNDIRSGRIAAPEFFFQNARVEPVGLPRALHDGATRRRFAAHEQRHADHALMADDRDFSGRAVLHHIEQRNDRRGRKKDVMKLAARLVQHFSQRHVDKGQVSGEVSAFVFGQRGKQVIFGNGRVVLHARLLRAADDGESGRYGRSGNRRDETPIILYRSDDRTGWRQCVLFSMSSECRSNGTYLQKNYSVGTCLIKVRAITRARYGTDISWSV